MQSVVSITVQNDIDQLYHVRDIDVAIAVHVGTCVPTFPVQDDIDQFHHIRDVNTPIIVHVTTQLILVVRLFVSQVQESEFAESSPIDVCIALHAHSQCAIGDGDDDRIHKISVIHQSDSGILGIVGADVSERRWHKDKERKGKHCPHDKIP